MKKQKQTEFKTMEIIEPGQTVYLITSVQENRRIECSTCSGTGFLLSVKKRKIECPSCHGNKYVTRKKSKRNRVRSGIIGSVFVYAYNKTVTYRIEADWIGYPSLDCERDRLFVTRKQAEAALKLLSRKKKMLYRKEISG